MSGPLFIFAPDRRGAEVEARERGLSPREWRYVSGPHDVYGRRDGRYTIRWYLPGLTRAQYDALHHLQASGFKYLENGS